MAAHNSDPSRRGTSPVCWISTPKSRDGDTAPPLLWNCDDEYTVCFIVLTEDGSFLIEVGQEEPLPPTWLSAEIESMGIDTDPWP